MSETDENIYRSCTYIPGLTEKIKKAIKPHENIHLGLAPMIKIEKLMSITKTHIPHINRGGGVYLIPCNNKQHVYIGETKRTLKIRLSEHQDNASEISLLKQQYMAEIDVATRTRSRSGNKSLLLQQAMDHLKRRATTSLAAHVIECDDEFDFPNAKILHPAKHWATRKLMEALYIKRFDELAVNHKRETANLTADVQATLHKLIEVNHRKTKRQKSNSTQPNTATQQLTNRSDN